MIVVIGGGLAGLTAAVAVREAGIHVRLHEAAGRLGGRARTHDGPYRANFGPHALYADGPTYGWLKQRGLLGDLKRPRATGFYFGVGDHLRRAPRAVVAAAIRLGGEAPVEVSFRDWAESRTSARTAEAAIGVAALPTYHPDPGELSAAFVQKRLQRILRRASATRYVVGGWETLVGRMADYARSIDVDIQLNSRIEALPDGPVIVATGATAADKLLGEGTVTMVGTRVALLDVGLQRDSRWPAAVLDLDRRVYVSRPSASVEGMAPPGHDVIQASAGIRPGESLEQAGARIEEVLDYALEGWRPLEHWRRRLAAEDATGAIDLPGQSWRDRPRIDRPGDVYLAGDYVAAPGMLSEVAHNSALQAATLAVQAANRRRTPTTAGWR